MRFLIALFFIFFVRLTFAGGFIFPNVPYSYARVYLFNTTEAAETDRPEFSIYADGVYSKSKLGEGWEFTEGMNMEMNTAFRTGIDMMVAGLSGCYIPRHGIIYFDKVGNPVASVSICFECQRIQFWSSQALPAFGTKYPEKEIPKIAKQFEQLEMFFTKNGIPVYKKTSDYVSYVTNSDSIYSTNGEMIFDYTNTAVFEGKNKYTKEDVNRWIIQPLYKFRLESETRFSQREGDTASWTYPTLTHQDGTHIIFSDLSGEEPMMTEASIVSSEVRLPNKISVGMSIDQVQNSFGVWDGIAWPASIIVNYKDANIRYVFENRTLVRIEVVMIRYCFTFGINLKIPNTLRFVHVLHITDIQISLCANIHFIRLQC